MFRHNSHVFEPEILPRSLSATYDEPTAHAPSSSSSACTRRPRSAIVVQGLHGVGKSTLVNTLLGTVPLCPSRLPCPSSGEQPQQNLLFSKAVEPATMDSCVRKPSFVIQCYGKTTDCGATPTTVRQPTWVTDMLSPMPPHQQQQEQQGDEQVSRVYTNTEAAPSVEGKLSLYGAMPMTESSSLHSRCLSDAQLRQYERHEHSGDTARIEEQRAKFLVGVTPALTAVHSLPLSEDAGGCRRLAASSVLALRTAVDDIWTTFHSERPSDLCCSPMATEASFLVVDLRLNTASVPEDEEEEVMEEEPAEGCTTTIVESQTVEERPAMHLAHTMIYVVTDEDVPMLAEIRRRRQEEEARQVEGRSGTAPQRPSSPLLAGSLPYASDSRRSAVLSSLAAAMTTRSTACRSIVVVNVRSLLLSRPAVSPAADRSAFAPEDDASAASSFDMCDTPRPPATTPTTTTTTTTTLRCPQECFTSTELDAARHWISRHWRVPLEDVFLFDVQRALMSRVLGSSPSSSSSSSSSSILSSLTSATHPTTVMLEPFLEVVALQQIKAAQEYASRRRLPRQRHEASSIVPFPTMKRDVVGETTKLVELSGGTTTISSSSKPGELGGEEGHTQSDPTENNNSNEAPARPASATAATDASRATGLRLRDAEAARDDHVAALLQQREAEQRAAALENRRQAEERLRDPQRRPGEQRYVPVVMRK